MKTSDFDYALPHEFIAQTPGEPRDHSRLMVLNRLDGSIQHRRFFDILDYLREGDVLVFNDSRVMPARLMGQRVDSGGKVEILLLRRVEANLWEALARPSKRLPTGSRIEIAGNSNGRETRALAEVAEVKLDGVRVIRFSDETVLPELGRVPLPPYIHLPLADPERYQTVYARVTGSAAAPTAGLHFTRELLDRLEEKGVCCLFITLHIGLDTFNPVREDDPTRHPIHREYAVLSQKVAGQLRRARKEGRRIICVGTTSVRTVEYAAQLSGPRGLQPFEGWVDLFILPGYQFQMVDALITNFHLPQSTLLMLVSAFTGSDFIRRAYQEAIARQYRFYSFGDAMLII